MIENTLILIKPDGVQRGLIGEIINRFEKVGLKIIGMKMIWIDKEFARKHYKEHVEKAFYPGLEAMITEGPVISMVLEGVDAVELTRKIVGSTEPKNATPGTIRGDYAHISYGHADEKGIGIKNLVHASATKEESKEEIKLWFKENEMYDYKNVNEIHIR
jgi:nucleoside-diphosphate kinase|tara:strand:+ start:54 stop:533 length:480 start_codon:yes stop_codon:yes gene_type:complete